MRALASIPLLIAVTIFGQGTSQDVADVKVLDFGCTTLNSLPHKVKLDSDSDPNAPISRQPLESSTLRTTIPESLERRNDTRHRMADLRSLEEEALRSSADRPLKTRNYYGYHTQVINEGGKVVKSIYWQYQSFGVNEQDNLTRQFVCSVKVKPNETKVLQVISRLAPTAVVNVSETNGVAQATPKEQVLINRIEYSDGPAWQRSGWSLPPVSKDQARRIRDGRCGGL